MQRLYVNTQHDTSKSTSQVANLQIIIWNYTQLILQALMLEAFLKLKIQIHCLLKVELLWPAVVTSDHKYIRDFYLYMHLVLVSIKKQNKKNWLGTPYYEVYASLVINRKLFHGDMMCIVIVFLWVFSCVNVSNLA